MGRVYQHIDCPRSTRSELGRADLKRLVSVEAFASLRFGDARISRCFGGEYVIVHVVYSLLWFVMFCPYYGQFLALLGPWHGHACVPVDPECYPSDHGYLRTWCAVVTVRYHVKQPAINYRDDAQKQVRHSSVLP